jgi:16S rRNA (adenine1518-N6/adenine1519-N6)-dimethyltransferase
MRDVKPKKHLGQHFLKDRNIAQRIVALLQAPPEAPVIEIGPGKGVLSQYLLPQYPNLQLVEIDDESVAYLEENFTDPAPQIVHEDFLKWDLAAAHPGDSHFIGTLPYNISSPIFFKLLENREIVKEGVFLIQREVARRICSPPGNKTYGILSVLLGYYFELKYAFTVPPGAFQPPPRVQSGVMRMERKVQEEAVEFSMLKKVVKAAFNQRRKTLRNALKGLSFSTFEGKEALMSKRAEQLPIEDFVRLTAACLTP